MVVFHADLDFLVRAPYGHRIAVTIFHHDALQHRLPADI